jgi:Pyrroloquinoline quinone (Coenzyme PQQ) biosynthesis protein C
MQRLFSPVFEQYNLLRHPFYLAWNEGRLTKEQMAIYAGEYGSFIQLISEGWQVAGEQAIAKEEEEHYVLWKNFAESLDAKNMGATIGQVNELVSSVKNCFGSYAGALGALYAFEAQQPATATSKLEGLKKHYSTGSRMRLILPFTRRILKNRPYWKKRSIHFQKKKNWSRH